MQRRLTALGLALCLLALAPRLGTAGTPDRAFPLRTGLFLKLNRGLGEVSAGPTRYPIVLAHGICGFDRLRWGPVEIRYFKDLERHLRQAGYDVFTTAVAPTGSIADRAATLARELRERWPTGKVNIIAHSMGGLDSRYMIARLGMAPRVATVTMIATPNHGTLLSDWTVYWAARQIPGIERLVRWLGIDTRGFHDLSVAHMERVFNPSVPDDPRIVYRSLGACRASLSDYFLPLAATHAINRGLERSLAGLPAEPSMLGALGPFGEVGPQLGHALSETGFREVLRGLPSGWLRPADVGLTDGMVSVSSAHHGTYVKTIEADHLAELGWSDFDARALYESLAAALADAGY